MFTLAHKSICVFDLFFNKNVYGTGLIDAFCACFKCFMDIDSLTYFNVFSFLKYIHLPTRLFRNTKVYLFFNCHNIGQILAEHS